MTYIVDVRVLSLPSRLAVETLASSDDVPRHSQ